MFKVDFVSLDITDSLQLPLMPNLNASSRSFTSKERNFSLCNLENDWLLNCFADLHVRVQTQVLHSLITFTKNNTYYI